jgi:hypothetical protein
MMESDLETISEVFSLEKIKLPDATHHPAGFASPNNGITIPELAKPAIRAEPEI